MIILSILKICLNIKISIFIFKLMAGWSVIYMLLARYYTSRENCYIIT
jgi:hypothetical protein